MAYRLRALLLSITALTTKNIAVNYLPYLGRSRRKGKRSYYLLGASLFRKDRIILLKLRGAYSNSIRTCFSSFPVRETWSARSSGWLQTWAFRNTLSLRDLCAEKS